MAFTVTPRVRRIAEAEWKLFEQVHNIGGRASCQDSPDTFFIMRSSQLMAWSEAMQESYWNDLITATQQGRNLLTEKYAYMMAQHQSGRIFPHSQPASGAAAGKRHIH